MHTPGNADGRLSELNRIYLWSIRHHRLRVTHECVVLRVAHMKATVQAFRQAQGV